MCSMASGRFIGLAKLTWLAKRLPRRFELIRDHIHRRGVTDMNALAAHEDFEQSQRLALQISVPT